MERRNTKSAGWPSQKTFAVLKGLLASERFCL